MGQSETTGLNRFLGTYVQHLEEIRDLAVPRMNPGHDAFKIGHPLPKLREVFLDGGVVEQVVDGVESVVDGLDVA